MLRSKPKSGGVKAPASNLASVPIPHKSWEGNDETLSFSRSHIAAARAPAPSRPAPRALTPGAPRSRNPPEAAAAVATPPPPGLSAMGATHARPTKRNIKDGSGGAVSGSACGCTGGGEAAQARKLRDLQKRFRKSDFDGSGGISKREMCR